MRRALGALSIGAALAAGADSMPFWYGGTEPSTNRTPASVGVEPSATAFKTYGLFGYESAPFELWTLPVGFMLFLR